MNKFTTKDIVTIVVVAVIFGILGAGWGFLWNIAFAIPVIGGVLSGGLSFFWFIAPMVSFYLVRKPGTAAATQLLAGIIAILAGHPAGVVVYGWYIIEAIGAELGFALFKYKRWDLTAMIVACTLQAFNYTWGLVYFQIYQYGFAAWFWPWVSTFLFAWLAAPIGLSVGKALSRTGMYEVPDKAAV
jgi:energy-coupling factor transport system permease protein